MLPPSVAAEPPPGWIATEIPRPVIGGGSGATFTQWSAMRAATSNGADVLLLGCLSTPIPGWVDDMRPSVEGRMLSFASGAAERIVGVPIETRPDGGLLSLRPVGATGEAAVGTTRTFLGWDGTAVMTCFATCATSRPSAPPHPRTCDASVTGAHLTGSTEPPPPGLALGAVTWAVHHPSKTVRWAALLAFFGGVVAIVSRRRPRSRI